MQFLYYPNTFPTITLKENEHKYLFKVRRTDKNELVKIRNLKDDYLYIYDINTINRKEAVLTLKNKILKPNKPHIFLHLAWCIIEPKNIEKTLPVLNEIGASKISFIYCDYSQKNFKLNLKRIEKILINSCQQCGRSDLMQIETVDSSKDFFEKYKKFSVLNFNGKEITSTDITQPVLIGPEGGFSKNEENNFNEIYKLKGFILRSESATCAIASKILL